jgi:hypothetical protein
LIVTTKQFDVLPAETLIAEGRNGAPADLVEQAPSLRLAAAETVREGYLLHYGTPRFYDFADRDLALLAGDRMYASGLAALAAAGDIEAVGLLAALISGCAEAHALSDSDRADRLWDSTLAMLAPGSD